LVQIQPLHPFNKQYVATTREIITSLREQGKSYNEIAEETGFSKSLISWHASEKHREYAKEKRRQNRKKLALQLKMAHGGKCTVCGYNKCLDALQFHHVDPQSKDRSLGSGVINLLHSHGRAVTFKEAEKCILVCANCHAEIHAKRSVA
jgi:predicted HNH restriction endonuclease